MKLTAKEQIWAFGVLASFLGLPIGLVVAGRDLLDFAQYTPVLPSITFIAASLCLTSLIECFDISLELKNSNFTERDRSAIVLHIIFMTLMLLMYFTTFVLNINKTSNAAYRTDFWEIALNVVMIVLAASLHLKTKRMLEKYI
ncbi:hypothetical protein [Neorhizobium tomejilense]|uniref:hypothetical protein n=1 Tax=Neorhizobium tomejilense TaxID=2093828 RepID=UPI003ECE73EB